MCAPGLHPMQQCEFVARIISTATAGSAAVIGRPTEPTPTTSRWITHGGATALDNLVLLCSRHHHLLHTPGWDAKLLPDNALEVTNPQGRSP